MGMPALTVLNCFIHLSRNISSIDSNFYVCAFYSEERRRNLEVGDKMSALLISKDGMEAKQYWEIRNGSFVVIDLETKKSKDGKK
ncbi:hypothetical protein LQV63_29550 [Paenibacillus profundus]|uniref:Uncharacterized protein n=1 Tax=Paenibacillus profundus TaxID=1173085 RepID=A0ABS8YSN7_9BACL|nr:hypothetical protein [Paenibacillus profundus]